MTSSSHSPRDRILGILANNGGNMERRQIEGTHREAICAPKSYLRGAGEGRQD